MELDRVRGQPGAVRVLKSLLRAPSSARAMLFSGPPGVGKRTAALAFARDILCLGPGGACGGCDSCRLASAGSHPDLVVVGEDRSKKELVLDDVKRFLRPFALRPLFERRCVILVDSERMNRHAQNALLKALEEPPPSTFPVLTSSNPEGLVETVRSRCAAVRFGPLAADALAQVLGVERDAAEKLSRASSGSARLARALLDRRELIEKAEAFCSRVGGEKALETLRLADSFAEAARKAGAREAASALLAAGREILMRSPGDCASQEALGEIIRAARALRSNVRVELVMRCLAWKLRERLSPKAA